MYLFGWEHSGEILRNNILSMIMTCMCLCSCCDDVESFLLEDSQGCFCGVAMQNQNFNQLLLQLGSVTLIREQKFSNTGI